MKIAIFYHCLFFKESPFEPLLPAYSIIAQQMDEIRTSGLLAASTTFVCGVNGGPESLQSALLSLPDRARILFHGLTPKNECHTILALEKWLTGHAGWFVLYLHSKGATRRIDDKRETDWRNCMMYHLVSNWRRCVADLVAGYDAVGCHWLVPPKTPPGQHIFGGNFWWAKADYLLTLPSIMNRARIKISGLSALESRYESEVWIGNGPKLPKVKDYHPRFSVHCKD